MSIQAHIFTRGIGRGLSVSSIHRQKKIGYGHEGGQFLVCMKGVDTWDTRGQFCNRLDGMLEVAMWLCVLWLCVPILVGLWYSLGLIPNFVALRLDNEGGALIICKAVKHTA